jgi:hypothetical protein
MLLLKKCSAYLQPAFYHIRKNRLHSAFCITSTALTFIFVTLILQFLRIYTSNYPPVSEADRIIRLEFFKDRQGNGIGGIASSEVNAFTESLKDFEDCALSNVNMTNIVANGHLHASCVAFVNAGFWKLYDFKFLYGRPFSEEECNTRKAVAVITENTSYTFFNSANGIGKKIKFQQREYEITGIVKDPSVFATPTEAWVWTPYVFNKFIPNGSFCYTVDALIPPTLSLYEAKVEVSQAVSHYFGNKNKTVDYPPQKVQTLRESMNDESNSNLLRYGGFAALWLFLLIPALNILSFGFTHTSNRAEEIAVRKTFGASRSYLFFLIISENLILTLTGAVIGLLLALPVMKTIQSSLMQSSFLKNISLLSSIDYGVIFGGVLPAVIIFSLLSGGIPAYLIARQPVAQVLKGGSK